MDIVVASNNQHKISEYRSIFKEFDINVLSLKDVNINVDFEETGKTFEENSLLKAKQCAQYTNKPILADDSGLVVEALPEILGVYTARTFGEDTPYPIKRQKLIDMLEGKDRTAKFVCCITIVNLFEEPVVFIGESHGSIAYKSSGDYGFAYDPVFMPKGYDKTFAELGHEVKNKISHRGRALEKFTQYLKTLK